MSAPPRLKIAATVLAKAAIFDQRKLGTQEEARLKVAAWAEALHPDTTEEDACRAVSEHYASSRDWLMPIDINRLTARYRADRLRRVKIPPPPRSLADDPLAELAWEGAYRTAIATGATTAAAYALADDTIARRLPRKETAS